VSASLKTGVACSQGPRSPCRRSVPLCLWKTVVHRYPVDEEQMHRRPQRTRRPIRNWVSVTTPLCLSKVRNGARETREKTRKGMRGVGWEAHVTSRDPTLDAVGTRSCAIRRGMSKKRASAIFDLSLLSRLFTEDRKDHEDNPFDVTVAFERYFFRVRPWPDRGDHGSSPPAESAIVRYLPVPSF